VAEFPAVPARVVPATLELVDAELRAPAELAAALGAALAPDWPPEFHSPGRLRLTRKALEDPAATGWWLHYVLSGRTLAGVTGYKGPPQDGVVELGYSIVPSHQRRGLATEAVGALVAAAWERGAEVVVAHTLPDREPSIGVLRKLGFAPIEPPEPGVLAFALRRR
jgi:[ribosomal protein S5]-alanine N-acetyltransferase